MAERAIVIRSGHGVSADQAASLIDAVFEDLAPFVAQIKAVAFQRGAEAMREKATAVAASKRPDAAPTAAPYRAGYAKAVFDTSIAISRLSIPEDTPTDAPTDTWPDPSAPGVPANPERDGWHWLHHPEDLRPMVTGWNAELHGWVSGGLHSPQGIVDLGYRYLGPALLPAEVAAREAAAKAHGMREAAGIARDCANDLKCPSPHCGCMDACAVQNAYDEAEAAILAAIGETKP